MKAVWDGSSVREGKYMYSKHTRNSVCIFTVWLTNVHTCIFLLVH